MSDLASALTGPIGGIIAGAWGAGAMMGYGFAHRTLSKRVNELKDEIREDKADCAREIGDLKNRLREVEDRQFYGTQRQLDQARDSALHLIDRGVITPPLGESA